MHPVLGVGESRADQRLQWTLPRSHSAAPLKSGVRFHKLIGQVVVNYTQKRPDRNNLQGDL